jgi:hypothetical protein
VFIHYLNCHKCFRFVSRVPNDNRLRIIGHLWFPEMSKFIHFSFFDQEKDYFFNHSQMKPQNQVAR